MTAPPDLREFDEKIADVRRHKEGAIDAQDFEAAARLRDEEKKLILAKAEREKQWKAGDMDVVAEVDEELIAEVLAVATGIPIVKLTEEESTPAAARWRTSCTSGSSARTRPSRRCPGRSVVPAPA